MMLVTTTVVKHNCIMPIDAMKASLAELVGVRSGYPFRGAIEGGLSGVPVVQMKDIHPDTGVEWEGVLRVELTGRKVPEWLDAGDILFVPRGQRFFAARVGPVPDQAVCGPHLMQLRVRSGSGLVPDFLAWQINQPPVQKQLHAAAEGTNQLSIRVSEIEALNLAVPPLKHQLHIVALAAAAARERQVFSRLVFSREQELAALAGDLARAAGINQA